MRKMFLSLIGVVIIASAGAAEPRSVVRKSTSPVSDRPVAATATSPAATATSPAANADIQRIKALEAAQAWLKSINYVVSLDQVPQQKKLQLQMYGSFNGISTQQLISNENLVHLRVMTGLEELSLPNWTSDEGLANVAGLNRLKTLNATVSRVTDAGMVHLKDLAALETVILHGTKVTGQGLMHLKGKPLVLLGLNQTALGDADMQTISSFTGLKSLFLVGTQITDASVPHLKKLTALTRLDLAGTKVSAAAKQELKTANPGLAIH